MYCVITEDGVETARTLKGINNRLKAKLDKVEFKRLGGDYIVTLTNRDLEFVQDKKRMSMIPIDKLYKTDNSKMMLMFILVLSFISAVRG